MAISPPGDIVLDVIRAADPQAARAASEALSSVASRTISASEAVRASEAFDRAFGADRAFGSSNSTIRVEDPEKRALHDSYQKFEAMVLQNFVQSMLPADTEAIFGKGTAGEVWKSMMAQQLANMIAEGGGIGIADSLAATGISERDASSEVEPELGGDQRNLATSLLQELQRDALQDWGAELNAPDGAFG